MKIKGLQTFKENLIDKADSRLLLKKQKSLEKAGNVIKDLRENRNWSWYDEIYYRNQHALDDVAIFYRGTEYTYREMLAKMEEYARSLKAMGIKKGMTIPVCMSNTPEFVFLLGAVSIVGAKANIFCADFEKDYVKEIIDSCDSDFMFIEDNEYEKISDLIGQTHVKKLVMTSLSDSLKNGVDPYEKYDKKFAHLFENKINFIRENSDSDIININEFSSLGLSYEGEVHEKVSSDDVFTITYSSGTTSNRPKPMEHAHRSFTYITRFHDKDVNHNPSYKMFNIQANIPTYSTTGLISGISDALTQGAKLSLEPIYHEDFVTDSMIINRPNYVDFTKSFWLKFAKDVLYNSEYSDVILPELLICFSVGEATEINEEKLINKALVKVKAGTKYVPFIPITRLSIAGGDCEHGGIYYTLFRAYQNLNPLFRLRNEEAGVGVFDLIDYDILDKDGNHCKPYQIGTLVAKSDVDMIGYLNNPEANEKFHIADANGKIYGNCSVDAYQDILGGLHIKGRQEGKVSTFEISDCALADRKNVLACTTINSGDYFVTHIEFMPEVKDYSKILLGIEKRIIDKFGFDVASKVLYRIHDYDESFKLTHSGKRDRLLLMNEGISDSCVKFDSNCKIIPFSEYVSPGEHDINKSKIKV